MSEQQGLVLVRGSGDVASAVGHTLFRTGYLVLLHDISAPVHSRRGMAFTDALFDGRTELDGVQAIRCDDLATVDELLAARQVIPILSTDFDALVERIRPAVLIDARMRKRSRPEVQRHLAPLTIGLGPSFVARETTHLAIETSWEDELGAVITHGATKPLAGEPRELAGHGRDRFVYAPVAGLFQTSYAIGQLVQQGQVIATIDETPLRAPLDGVLRGLTRSGVMVEMRTKVIEVDPRGAQAVVTGLGERPRRIAEGVLQAIQASGLQ